MSGDIREYLVWARLLSHQRRVEKSREILRRAAAKGRLVVSSSWGKDSIALSHLAIDTLGPVDILHMESPCELPGNEETIAYFQERARVHILPSSRTLEEVLAWCHEVGLPHERTSAVQGMVVKSTKKDRAGGWCKEHGFEVQALGMQAWENPWTRGMLYKKRGTLYQARGMWFAGPLAWWTAKDTWAYVLSRGLPYNKRIYDAETHGQSRERIRNTGWLSTDGVERGRLSWLRRHFSAEWEKLIAEFPYLQNLA